MRTQEHPATADAAKLMGVSPRYVEQAKRAIDPRCRGADREDLIAGASSGSSRDTVYR